MAIEISVLGKSNMAYCGETVTDRIKTLKIVWQRYMTTNVQNAVNPATWMWICNNQNNIML